MIICPACNEVIAADMIGTHVDTHIDMHRRAWKYNCFCGITSSSPERTSQHILDMGGEQHLKYAYAEWLIRNAVG